ncbi:MAG: hypothetical protein D6736_13545 [Nitrospinota bacterium]|nr:MAG: hypothetical protein D6736_13545 [Nitrospinota bacterium]
MQQRHLRRRNAFSSDDGRRWIELRTAAALLQETPESLLRKLQHRYSTSRLPVYSRKKQAMWRASIQEILAIQDEVEIPLSWIQRISEKE